MSNFANNSSGCTLLRFLLLIVLLTFNKWSCLLKLVCKQFLYYFIKVRLLLHFFCLCCVLYDLSRTLLCCFTSVMCYYQIFTLWGIKIRLYVNLCWYYPRQEVACSVLVLCQLQHCNSELCFWEFLFFRVAFFPFICLTVTVTLFGFWTCNRNALR